MHRFLVSTGCLLAWVTCVLAIEEEPRLALQRICPLSTIVSSAGRPVVLDEKKTEREYSIYSEKAKSLSDRVVAGLRLAGTNLPNVTKALTERLTIGDLDTEEERTLTATAIFDLKWSSATENDTAIRALYNSLRDDDLPNEIKSAVALALLDSRGGEEVLASMGKSLRRENGPLSVRRKPKDSTLDSFWKQVSAAIKTYHLSATDKRIIANRELDAIIRFLKTATNVEIAEMLEDGSGFIWDLAILCNSDENIQSLLKLLSHSDPTVRNLSLRAIQQFKNKRVIGQLSVDSLKEMSRAEGLFPDNQATDLRDLISIACHGMRNEIFQGSTSILDVALTRLTDLLQESKTPNNVGVQLLTKRESTRLYEAGIAMDQLCFAAFGDEKRLKQLLPLLSDDKMPLAARLGICERLCGISRESDSLREKVAPSVRSIVEDAITKGHARIVYLYEMLYLTYSVADRTAFLKALPTKFSTPTDSADFLEFAARNSYNQERDIRKAIAQALCDQYEQASKDLAEKDSIRVMQTLLNARLELSPETLTGEIPSSIPLKSDSVALRFTGISEWRTWLARFQSLSIFQNR